MDYHFNCAKLCLADELIAWFNQLNAGREREGLPALAGDLNEIAIMYGRDRLEQEYASLVSKVFETPFDEHAQDPFSEPMYYDEEAVRQVEQRAGMKAAKKVNFNEFFKLKLVSEVDGKYFGLKRYRYEVEIAPIPVSFTNESSIEAIPKILETIFELCTTSFLPTDRIIIEIGNDSMVKPFNLHLREFRDFNVSDLFERVKLMNSSRKFNIDESFQIRIIRVRIPSGGVKRKFVHCKYDRNRMSKSLVSVHVEKNLCLPAALFLGAFRQEHNVTKSPWSSRWKNLIRKEKNAKREMEAIKIVAECGLSVGNMFDLDDVEKFQRGYFRNYQIIVISAGHAN